MMHILIMRYTGRAQRADPYAPAHAEYLQRHHEAGTFLVSGQTLPKEIGGAILAVGVDRAEVEHIVATDPFVTAGVGSYEIITMDPARVHPILHGLMGLPAVAGTGWDEAAFNQFRSGTDVVALLAARPITPVLQHAGRALLTALTRDTEGIRELARQCAHDLDARSWEGDDQLALELRHTFGEAVTAGQYGVPAWPLQTVPVDLDDLADHLEGDPLQGRGVLDLRTGEVWPPGINDYDPPPELDPDSPGYDEDRWLYFSPESGDGYRDMLDFTDHITSDHLRQRLRDALDGRGAFRRFRDVLHDAPADVLTQWRIFSQERILGRARSWLAHHGYRPAP